MALFAMHCWSESSQSTRNSVLHIRWQLAEHCQCCCRICNTLFLVDWLLSLQQCIANSAILRLLPLGCQCLPHARDYDAPPTPVRA
jgi:hypothetical protein